MLQRDPQVRRDRIGRSQLAPVTQHRVLHPVEVARVVDVPHEIDVGRVDTDPMVMAEVATHIAVNSMRSVTAP